MKALSKVLTALASEGFPSCFVKMLIFFQEKSKEAEKYLAHVMLIQRERREEMKRLRRSSRTADEKMTHMREESCNRKRERIIKAKYCIKQFTY